jgi:hypothetical protein
MRGVVTAEFSIVLVWFMLLCCGVLELARVLYMFNTLQAVTLRAASTAAHTDFSDPAALAALRQQALLRDGAGGLVLGAPVSAAYVRIDYLALTSNGAAMTPIAAAALPACPANNRLVCMKDPYDASCIRLVRARICDPADSGECRAVLYQPLFSFLSLPLTLPTASAIAAAETLGALPGAAPCP